MANPGKIASNLAISGIIAFTFTSFDGSSVPFQVKLGLWGSISLALMIAYSMGSDSRQDVINKLNEKLSKHQLDDSGKQNSH